MLEYQDDSDLSELGDYCYIIDGEFCKVIYDPNTEYVPYTGSAKVISYKAFTFPDVVSNIQAEEITINHTFTTAGTNKLAVLIYTYNDGDASEGLGTIKWGWRMQNAPLTTTLTVTSAFVAVTDITGVSTTATVGTPLTLTGTAAPTNATNQIITWSIKSAETTGANITDGNILNTTAAGTVTVTATIANGLTTTTPYTKDFNIIVLTTSVKTISVGAQNGTLTAGVAGTVTFPVTTTNIADGEYLVSINNMPTGMSIQGVVTINGGTGTLTLAGGTETVSGTTNNLNLIIDETVSANFTMVITAAGTVLKGDINDDGKVNGMDLLLMKQHILDVPGKKIEEGTKAFKAADMNDDGKINGMDLLLLKKKILS